MGSPSDCALISCASDGMIGSMRSPFRKIQLVTSIRGIEGQLRRGKPKRRRNSCRVDCVRRPVENERPDCRRDGRGAWIQPKGSADRARHSIRNRMLAARRLAGPLFKATQKNQFAGTWIAALASEIQSLIMRGIKGILVIQWCGNNWTRTSLVQRSRPYRKRCYDAALATRLSRSRNKPRASLRVLRYGQNGVSFLSTFCPPLRPIQADFAQSSPSQHETSIRG